MLKCHNCGQERVYFKAEKRPGVYEWKGYLKYAYCGNCGYFAGKYTSIKQAKHHYPGAKMRPPTYDRKKWDAIIIDWFKRMESVETAKQMAARLGCTRTTLYRYVQNMRNKRGIYLSRVQTGIFGRKDRHTNLT